MSDYCLRFNAAVIEVNDLTEENERLQKLIAELEAANKWIRTEDQRPRDGQHVLVYSEWHDFSTDAFYHRPDVWEDQLGNVAQVSHWMTFPDTPESEGGADEVRI